MHAQITPHARTVQEERDDQNQNEAQGVQSVPVVIQRGAARLPQGEPVRLSKNIKLKI